MHLDNLPADMGSELPDISAYRSVVKSQPTITECSCFLSLAITSCLYFDYRSNTVPRLLLASVIISLQTAWSCVILSSSVSLIPYYVI